MSPTKSYCIEKRITRSVARIILNSKSDQTSSMVVEIDKKWNNNVKDNRRKEMKKKEKVVPAANVSNAGLTQAELPSVVEEIGVTSSSAAQSCHSSVSDHLRSVVTSSAASFSNTSSVTSHMLSDISNIYNPHDNGTNDNDKEEQDDDNKRQEKDDHDDHYKETYSIAVGPITWGKTKRQQNI